MSPRFDLEQDILQCWHVVDDIDLLLKYWDKYSEDDKLNFLLGLKTIYEAKFNKTFATFEQCVRIGEV